jgi:hypothetical protein
MAETLRTYPLLLPPTMITMFSANIAEGNMLPKWLKDTSQSALTLLTSREGFSLPKFKRNMWVPQVLKGQSQ